MAKSEYKKRFENEINNAETRQKSLLKNLTSPATGLLPQDKVELLTKIAFASNDTELRSILAIAADIQEPAQARALALSRLNPSIGDRPGLLKYLIDLLLNKEEPFIVRIQALKVLQQNSFRAAKFKAWRPEFLNALRIILSDDSAELRVSALEILAQNKDEFAERVLIDGLRNSAVALVPPEFAIQLLGNDIHGEHYSLLKEIVITPPNEQSKIEALKLLAADGGSKDFLIPFFTNKAEPAEVRTVAGIGLQNLDPKGFAELAANVILDAGENEQVKAVCINAISQSVDYRLFNGERLQQKVEELNQSSLSEEVRKASGNYLDNLKSLNSNR